MSYRSPAIPNMAEFFGVDASEVFDAKEQAEAYLAGTQFAAKMHKLIHEDFAHRSRNFREHMLEGLREAI